LKSASEKESFDSSLFYSFDFIDIYLGIFDFD
jgi:hypothetical protein